MSVICGSKGGIEFMKKKIVQNESGIWQYVPEDVCAILVDGAGRGKGMYSIHGVRMIEKILKKDSTYMDYLIKLKKDEVWPYFVPGSARFIYRPGMDNLEIIENG